MLEVSSRELKSSVGEVEAFSWWLSFLLGWLKLFQGVRFFLVDCEFVLGVGEFRLTIYQQIIIL